MREIKFRAWDAHLKSMHRDIHKLDSFNEWIARDRFILMQFTGLHDKNGDDKEFVGVCEYQECAFVFSWKTKSGDETWCAPYETSHFEEPCLEVIGNIHENPELIEG